MTTKCQRAVLATMFPEAPSGSTFFYEQHLRQQNYSFPAGLDEAGRGPLAGPVVASCVILSPACDFSRYKDSKKLSPSRRERLYVELYDSDALIGVGIASAVEIFFCRINFC